MFEAICLRERQHWLFENLNIIQNFLGVLYANLSCCNIFIINTVQENWKFNRNNLYILFVEIAKGFKRANFICAPGSR